jgi:hypothetical protein
MADRVALAYRDLLEPERLKGPEGSGKSGGARVSGGDLGNDGEN